MLSTNLLYNKKIDSRQERVKEVEKERDALLLSLSLQSKSTEKQKAVEDKGNSLLDVRQSVSTSLSSNIICDQADENKEAAHASPKSTEHSAEQYGTRQSKRKTIDDSAIKAIEEQKHSKSQSVKKIC